MITLTPKAQSKITSAIAKRGKGLGLRIGIKTTGCSGLAYVIEYVDIINEEDVTFLSEGITIAVDPKSLVYVDGMTIDYVRNGLNEGFEFNNSREKDRCGCGESFRV